MEKNNRADANEIEKTHGLSVNESKQSSYVKLVNALDL